MLPIKPLDAPLYVVTMVSNPARFKTRYHLARAFDKYVENSGAILYTCEIAFGDRPFEVTEAGNPRHLQLRTTDELWHKENALNLAIQRLPADWKYVAWVDADVTFARPDWAQETIQQLQHYDVVQMFRHATDLGPNSEPLAMHRGFVWSWMQDGRVPTQHYETSHPGYAWAARRTAIDAVGGLIDWGIVGSADRYMAYSLVGEVASVLDDRIKEHCPTYVEWCLDWEDRCTQHIKQNIGVVDGLLLHHFHGRKENRHYGSRWKMLADYAFNPQKDMKKDSQGLWQLSGNKIKLRDALRAYNRSRNEDSPEL